MNGLDRTTLFAAMLIAVGPLGSHCGYGPTRQGFDEFFGIRDGFIDNYIHYFLQGEGFHDLYEGTSEVWDKDVYFPGMVVKRANQFLEQNGDNPFFKGIFLEGGIRVPAIISYPDRLPSCQVRGQAIWYPTILEICGIRHPPVKLDGRGLLDVIRSDTAPSPHPVLYFQWQNNWAVREGDWKLIRHKGNRPTAREYFILHNLADENPEVIDYVNENPEKVKHLGELHDRWQENLSGG